MRVAREEEGLGSFFLRLFFLFLLEALLGQTRRVKGLRELRPHPLHLLLLLLLPPERRSSEELERAGVNTFGCRARQRRRGEQRQAFS